MKCPFELPVRKVNLASQPFVEDRTGIAFCKCKNEEIANYLVHVLNSRDKLEVLCELLKQLKEAGMTLDAITADAMRHVLNSIKDINAINAKNGQL